MTARDYFDSPAPTRRTTRNPRFFGAILPLVFALVFIWPMNGSEKIQMNPNPDEDPGAEGMISVSQSKNGNTKIDVKVNHLVKPSGLKNPASVYVVWIQPEGQAAKNEGEIMIDENRSGELKSETPFKRFHVFITPEDKPTVMSPTGPHVLSAMVK